MIKEKKMQEKNADVYISTILSITRIIDDGMSKLLVPIYIYIFPPFIYLFLIVVLLLN
jgi:hypothetical protein